MGKPKIQPLAALIRSGLRVRLLFFRRHGLPDPLTLLVAPNVVELDKHGEDGVPGNDAENGRVSASIIRLVIFAIYLYPMAPFCQKLAFGYLMVDDRALTLEAMMLLICTVML